MARPTISTEFEPGSSAYRGAEPGTLRTYGEGEDGFGFGALGRILKRRLEKRELMDEELRRQERLKTEMMRRELEPHEKPQEDPIARVARSTAQGTAIRKMRRQPKKTMMGAIYGPSMDWMETRPDVAESGFMQGQSDIDTLGAFRKKQKEQQTSDEIAQSRASAS